MKTRKLFVIAGLAGSLAFTGCNGGGSGSVEIKTFEDSVSYAIGIDVSNNMAASGGFKLNPDVIAQGMKDNADSNAKFNDSLIAMVLNKFQVTMKEKAVQAAQAKNNEFLNGKKAEAGVQSTPSGLLYKVVTPGTGKQPTLADQVKVHYQGSLIDGNVFDSSYERGEPITFPLANVIKGWQEGLQLMQVGAKYELYIPSDLAYGERGNQGIPPNSALVFQVELLDVLPGAAMETPPPPPSRPGGK